MAAAVNFLRAIWRWLTTPACPYRVPGCAGATREPMCELCALDRMTP